MVSGVLPPNPRLLLPPLLACLPAYTYAPQRPPPALLPLLSPILRQRVQLLSPASATWLELLSWDPQRAAKLPGIVQALQLEPHPVSGEIEVDDVDEIKFRRLDAETLQSRMDAQSSGLCFIHLWCTGDDKGGGDGWRLTELRALEDGDDGSPWYEWISEAEAAAGPRRAIDAAVSTANGTNGTSNNNDDDYWASYDRTPAQTPAKRSPATVNPSLQMRSNPDLNYFARYMAEVQPAMDPHDPSEVSLPPGQSTLNGSEMTRALGLQSSERDWNRATENGHTDGTRNVEETRASDVAHPRPSSSSSRRSVERLEKRADTQSQAEVAIKQHISTDLKSLYRLARNAGIERDEFERIVMTELDCLDMMERDE